MVRAIELVRDEKADAIISAGNTGALVAGSMKLGRLDGVERPAIVCRFPSLSQDFVMLDCGANAVAEPSHLAQFAVMGSVYAREILGTEKPVPGAPAWVHPVEVAEAKGAFGRWSIAKDDGVWFRPFFEGFDPADPCAIGGEGALGCNDGVDAANFDGGGRWRRRWFFGAGGEGECGGEEKGAHAASGPAAGVAVKARGRVPACGEFG